MSWLPQTKRKLRLRSPSKPNYSDFQGPPDGDYVRYVQDLMDWAELESERARWQAARQAPIASGTSSTPSRKAAPSAKATPVERKAQRSGASAANALAQTEWGRSPSQAPAVVNQLLGGDRAQQAEGKDKPAAVSLTWVALAVSFVLVAIFAPDLMPILIIGWMAGGVALQIHKAKKKAADAPSSAETTPR